MKYWLISYGERRCGKSWWTNGIDVHAGTIAGWYLEAIAPYQHNCYVIHSVTEITEEDYKQLEPHTG